MPTMRRRYTFELRAVDPRIVVEEKRGINPFTRQPMILRTNKGGWSAETEAAVHALLDQREARCDDDGYHIIGFPAAAEVQVCFGFNGTDGEGSEVNILCRDLTDEVAQFVLDVVRTAEMVMVPSFEEDVPAALPGPSTDPKVHERWPGAVILQTPDALRDWLGRLAQHEDGFGGF